MLIDGVVAEAKQLWRVGKCGSLERDEGGNIQQGLELDGDS